MNDDGIRLTELIDLCLSNYRRELSSSVIKITLMKSFYKLRQNSSPFLDRSSHNFGEIFDDVHLPCLKRFSQVFSSNHWMEYLETNSLRHISKMDIPLIWAIKWVDYSDTNQGFGYQLSDGSYGVLFRNETKMMLLGDGELVCFVCFSTLQSPDMILIKMSAVFLFDHAKTAMTMIIHEEQFIQDYSCDYFFKGMYQLMDL